MATGFLLARLLVAVYFRIKRDVSEEMKSELTRSCVLTLVWTNCGNIPWMIVESLVKHVKPFTDDPDGYYMRGFSYINIYGLPYTLTLWTVGYSYFVAGVKTEKRKSPAPSDEEAAVTTQPPPHSGSDVELRRVAAGAPEAETVATAAEAASDQSAGLVAASPAKAPSKGNLWWRFVGATLAWWERHGAAILRLCSPQNASVIIGLVIGLVPFTNRLVVQDAGKLHFVWDITRSLGSPCVTVSNIVLGASLSRGPQASSVGRALLAAHVVLKLVVAPALSMAVAVGAKWAGLVPLDPMFFFVMGVESAVPSAVVLVMLSQVFQVGRTTIPTIQFWHIIVSLLTLTFWTVLSLKIATLQW
eukprot:TRINITY_DN3982_c0_g1_i18.p1 TRINITY_DN3982_c0_g1~~TRINITY_DN3982_c0_g1_i18.p1  ORF type:complete len:359 (-),score=101.21 TRINITY_DN3982_c0_g1_i18:1279-2355(-)